METQRPLREIASNSIVETLRTYGEVDVCSLRVRGVDQQRDVFFKSIHESEEFCYGWSVYKVCAIHFPKIEYLSC